MELRVTRVSGYWVEEDGVVYAVSNDGRFVTSGTSQGEAFAAMRDVLDGYFAMAVDYGFEPFRKLSAQPYATDKAKVWEHEPVPA